MEPKQVDEPATPSGSPPSQRGATRRWLRRRAREGLFRLATRWLPRHGPQPLPDLGALERVLLVHVNQRLGNTILVTPGLSELLERMRGARVVLIGGGSASQVFGGYRLERIEALSRLQAIHPWRLFKLVRWLRAERFDAAIHLGTSTRSIGPYLVGVSGARHRIGRQREGRSALFTTPVARATARHKVDVALDFVASLGVPAAGERRIPVSAREVTSAGEYLRDRVGPEAPRPVGVFVGGRARKGKSWSLSNFAAVADGARARGIPVLVFLGPEERSREGEIRRAIGEAVYARGKNVREVASILAHCGAVLTLDAGTMHLSIAAGAPTAAVFRKPNFDRWGPRRPAGEVIYDPEGTGAGRALETLLRLYDEAPVNKPAFGAGPPVLRVQQPRAPLRV